jgi:hypothetical protein
VILPRRRRGDPLPHLRSRTLGRSHRAGVIDSGKAFCKPIPLLCHDIQCSSSIIQSPNPSSRIHGTFPLSFTNFHLISLCPQFLPRYLSPPISVLLYSNPLTQPTHISFVCFAPNVQIRILISTNDIFVLPALPTCVRARTKRVFQAQRP